MARRINIELEDGDYRYLKDRAEREGRSMVSVIREAIRGLRGSEMQDPRADPMYQVGSFEGPRDLAERHDFYLYESS
jgi:hypothetical protein